MKKGTKVVFAEGDKLRRGTIVGVWTGDGNSETTYTIRYEVETDRTESQVKPR